MCPDFELRTHAAYREVEMEDRPQVRWWLPEGLATDDTLDSNLEQIHDAGFGGIEIIATPEDGVDHTVYGWGSDEWNEDSRRVVRGAVRRRLAFSLTSGAHWGTANIPDTHAYGRQPYDLDNPAAAQELGYASVVIRGGETFAGPVPLLTLPDKAKNARVVTLLGVLAVHLERGRRSIEAADGTSTQTQGVLDLTTVVDLTQQVAEGGGAVEVTAPDGVDVELVCLLHPRDRSDGRSVLPYLRFLVKNSDREGAVVASSRLALLIAAGAVRNGGNGRVITNYRAESEDSSDIVR